MTASAKLTSCHCSPRHSEIRRPVPAAKSVRVRSGSCRLSSTAYALFRGENHRFVPACGSATDEAHRVRFLISRNQPVTLAVPVDQRHNTAHFVEGWICEALFALQGFQPFLHLQRFEAQRDPIPPLWQQSIAEHSLVTSNCRVCFWMDRFGGFDELMFRIVMCQIRKCCTSAGIHLVDVEMLSFDLRPCTTLAREVLEKANWNFVLDSLTIGLPNGTKEQRVLSARLRNSGGRAWFRSSSPAPPSNASRQWPLRWMGRD